MKQKTVRLTDETAIVVENQEKPTYFMRHAIEKEVSLQRKSKTKLTIKIKFAGASAFNDELEIKTYATGKLKEKINPLLDAVETLQNVILFLDC